MNIKINVLLASLLLATCAYAGDGSTIEDYGGASISDATSPHNLAGSNAGDNGEVCVYCHTPHAANVSFAGAPIWNKADNLTAFKMYGASSTGVAGATRVAKTATDATPNSPSLACLSCHDGVSAVDSILNAPGSGMNTIAGSQDIIAIVGGVGSAFGGNIGGSTSDPKSETNTIGDLSNDHPVSIVYTAGTASLRPTGDPLPAGLGGVWKTPSGAQIVSQLLRNDRVECSSCHDPHNATGLAQGTATSKQVNYLRHTNRRSELCLGCHDK